MNFCSHLYVILHDLVLDSSLTAAKKPRSVITWFVLLLKVKGTGGRELA